MIISRAPTRITLGGGGTDLASFYSRHGGFLVAGAIDKYVFVSVNKRFYESIRLSYSKTEIVGKASDLKHTRVREALKSLGTNGGIEIVSIADVPANCGLGSSSSFMVALLNALHAYKREFVSLDQLAEEACQIEIGVLQEPIGKQDQYISAFGGLTCLTFDRNGDVLVEPLRMPNELLYQLESSILLFYTGIERSASEILSEQDAKTKKGDSQVMDNLLQIKEIGLESRKVLEKGDLDAFGDLLDVHWNVKRRISGSISSSFIDECYEVARKNGALGGKIMGAGGGGFFMFYCNGNGAKVRLTDALKKCGLKPMYFRFDFEGVKVLVNMRKV
ncbi:MAG: hypothetical protein A2Y72_01035 [Chloroflexi bacterium RBG_13_53_26]|nr:MAG: hypothetical protein A2Y72_01035 [Chloroflexi bacterium RBG_13_53_26]